MGRVWVAVSFFATGAFLGALLTHFAPMTVASWRYWVGARIAWQLGGAVWAVTECAAMIDRRYRTRGVVIGVAVGLALTSYPVRDMIDGSVSGVPTDASFQKTSVNLHARIVGSIDIHPAVGDDLSLEVVGYKANVWEAALKECGGRAPRVTALRHLGSFLGAECSR